MRRVSGLILMILKSYSLPGSRGPAFFSGPVVGRKLDIPSSRRLRSSISVLWQSASMLSPNSTNAPKVAMRETLPFTICPTLCCLNQSPQMSFTCLMPSDTRRFSAKVLKIDPENRRVSLGIKQVNDIFVLLEPVAPDVVHLLDAQRYAAVFRIDLQHFGGDVFALLKHLVRILDALRPAHIADVHQPIETLFDFDERAELGDIAHLAGHDRAHWILLRDEQPGVGLRLLDSERNAPIAWLDVQHYDVHFIANFGNLRGVLDLLVPAHFGNVHEAFDALFQLDKHAIVHDPNDFAPDLSAGRIFLRRSHPRIGH